MEETIRIDTFVVTLRSAGLGEIVDLRWAVLRTGLPRDWAVFDGDEHPATRHFAAVAGWQVVGCATFMRNPFESRDAWQLRGMATSEAFRGKSVGARLLSFATQRVLEEFRPTLLWCNARAPAVKFYEQQGWRVVSEEFEIPTAGPHRRMTREFNASATQASR